MKTPENDLAIAFLRLMAAGHLEADLANAFSIIAYLFEIKTFRPVQGRCSDKLIVVSLTNSLQAKDNVLLARQFG
jgi:hypothetical protein